MRLFLICAAILGLAVSGPYAKADDKRLSLDDMMKVEGIGSAVIDPSGRWLVYERLRPYDEIEDYSFRTYAFGKSGHQLWRYDLDGGGEPELLPGIDPAPHTWAETFSPSGRYLAFVQYRFGTLSLGAYDMVEDVSVTFQPTPAVSRTGAYNPVWISDTELVFTALPVGEQPMTTSVRAVTGNRLAKAWVDAWKNTAPTADEVRTQPLAEPGGLTPGRLVRANATNGQVQVLARGLHADLRLSPDRSALATLAVSSPERTDPNRRVESDLHHYTITLFDLSTGTSSALAPELEVMPYTISWDPAGRGLAAFGWRRGADPRSGRFHVVDSSTSAVTRFDHVGLDLVSERERGGLQRPERAMFLNDTLALFARPIPATEDQTPRFTHQDIRPAGLPAADWYQVSATGHHENLTEGLPGVSGVPVHAGPGHITLWSPNGVYRLSAEGERRRLAEGLIGRLRYLTAGTFMTRSGVVRPEFADEGIFRVDTGSTSKIVMLDLREGQEEIRRSIATADADMIPLAGSMLADAVVFTSDDGVVTELLVGRTSDNRPPTAIALLNGHLADVDFGTWQKVSYQVADPAGILPTKSIETCLLIPPDADSATQQPLIVDVYPGASGGCRDTEPHLSYPDPHSPYLWAGMGYAYARVTTPTARIRTKEGPIAGLPSLVDAGVDAIIATGRVDPDRIVLHGFSQGGVSALYVAAHSKRYRAVIAKNGWADLFSHYFGGTGVYAYFYEDFGAYLGYDSVKGSDFGIGRTPFEDPETYYRNSPVFLARRIDTPVLLMHSDLDSFDMAQFDEMFGALKRAGKDARYVRYWGEGHGPSSPANIRDMWGRMLAFLDEQGAGSDP